MRSVNITDRDKLKKLIDEARVSRSEIARLAEVSYKTVYRWLDKGVRPHPAQSRRIDELFKEYVDLTGLVESLKKGLGDPIKRIRQDRDVRERLFLDMTYNSNAIEGSRMTLKETEAAIDGRKVRGKELFEVLEAVNHDNALKYILETVRPDFRIDEAYIFKLHSIILYNFNDRLPGRYRTGYVNVTNTELKLPSAQAVPIRMRALLKTINHYGRDVVKKISSDHYEFEAIHPFFDGNGRVGRLIMLTQALAKGYPPLYIQVEDRHKYYTALAKGDMGDFKSLIQVVCDGMIKGYNLLKHTAISLLIILPLLFTCGISVADRVYFSSGSSMEGVINSESDKAVELNVGFGTVTIAKSEIKSIYRSTPDELFAIRAQWETKRKELEGQEEELAKERQARMAEYEKWAREESEMKAAQESASQEISVIKDSASGSMLVDATLNGKVKVSLVIDTGASMVVLSKKTGEALGIDLTETGKEMAKLHVADNRTIDAKIVKLDSIKVDDVEVKDVIAAIVANDIGAIGTRDGLLGMTFLGRFNIKLDLARSKMVLDTIKK